MHLRENTRDTLDAILSREKQATPEDVVAMSIEVFNVITEHLSQKDAVVFLHTPGESLQTLHLGRTPGSYTKGVRTQHKTLNPTRTTK